MFRLGFLVCLAASLALASLAPASDASPNIELARQLNQSFADVAEKVSPAVVVINVMPKAPILTRERIDDSSKESAPPDSWRRFHQQFEDTPSEPLPGQGSGIIIREDGYIITNGHVVEDADRIRVRLKDGRLFKGLVRGVDLQSDVAVIKIEARGLPVAKFADSTKTRVGEFAIAIGTPYDLDYTVTFGHVSAKSRAIPELMGVRLMDQDFIQTDANINPGNSGGPLLNIDGEIIGINTLIRGLHTGIGFAIPSNLAREISEQLIAQGKFTRAWLGLSIFGLKDNLEFHELIKGIDEGVVIRAILPNGPAAKSGLRPSDIITTVDGRKVTTPQELRNEVRGKKIGEPVTLGVYREGKTLEMKITPAEWVTESTIIATHEPAKPLKPAAMANLGVTVQPLTHELAKQFNVDMVQGVIVTTVEKASPAARGSIKPGDVITAINHRAVADVEQFRSALSKADLTQGVLVNLVCSETSRFEILKDEKE